MVNIIRDRFLRNKILAIVAGGAVIGIGATATLASWNDQEWVFADNGTGGPGVGTSSFDIQQTTATTLATASWGDFETQAAAKGLTFTLGALALSPGTSVFAPVALSSTPATDVDGTLTLEQAVSQASASPTDDATGLLWTSLVLNVSSVTTAPGAAFPACDANFATLPTATAVITNQTGLSGAAAALSTQGVTQARGNIVHYCFEITLPAGASTTLQNRTVAPAWEFSAESN